METQRSNTSVRLTPEATRLLKELAKKLGVSQTAIIEMAIRKFAKSELSLEEIS
jgi:predicted transcriptional regulator